MVDPATREATDQVFFGATVTVAHGNGDEKTYSIVGIDEFMKDCKLRQSASTWMPVMVDFKHVPSDRPKESKRSFMQRLGLDRKPPLPPGFMGEWEALNRRLEKEAL